jgi:hypothetical protein
LWCCGVFAHNYLQGVVMVATDTPADVCEPASHALCD